jgi:hypothetical protein
MANANPYGIKVSTETTQPPPITSALPMFAPSKPSAMASNEDARGNWIPPEVPGHELQGPTPSGEPLGHVETQEEVPDLDLSNEAKEALAGPKSHTFADVGGQRFEVPQGVTHETSLGPKYDAILNHAVNDLGIDPKLAFTGVLAMAEKDAALTSKDTSREDTQDFTREMSLNREDKLSEAEKNRIARMKKTKGSGGGGVSRGMAELIQMKEQGQPDSMIAARAAELHIPMGGKTGYLQAIKEVRAAANAGARLDEKRDQEMVIGPDGKPVTGINPKLAGKAAEANVGFAQVKERLRHLIDDIATNGTRVMPWDIEGTKRRQSAAGEVVAALRKYNELNATDASIRLEHEITGGAGTLGDGIWSGAQPGVLQHLLDEAEARHGEQLRNYTRPPSAAKPSAGQSAGTTTVHMPDGSVQVFDASGKRVK